MYVDNILLTNFVFLILQGYQIIRFDILIVTYLLLRCILKLGRWTKTIKSIVFNVEPNINIRPYIITNIIHEISVSITLLGSLTLTLLFAIISVRQIFLLVTQSI